MSVVEVASVRIQEIPKDMAGEVVLDDEQALHESEKVTDSVLIARWVDAILLDSDCRCWLAEVARQIVAEPFSHEEEASTPGRRQTSSLVEQSERTRHRGFWAL